ncbi:MAG: FAD-dependent monooxygenase [Chloroflexota bacterium]|nr:FAD-dependent monooxygenase [Chloroflexota bacterium]
MSGDEKRRALIIGGGFAGLAAAIALQRVGIEAVVFEQADAVRSIDAGLVMQITAMKALRKLGLLESMHAIVGRPIAALQLQRPDGKVLATIPQSRLGHDLGTPAYVVHRGDLLDVLVEAAGRQTIRVNARCVGFEHDLEGVTARFADGQEEHGGVLLGADGIHSIVRKGLLGDTPLRYSGYTAWRAMPHFTGGGITPGILQQASGAGQIFGIYPSDGRVYWFAGKKVPPGGQDPPRGRKRELLDHFAHWHPPIAALIEATAESAVLRHDVYDREPVERWGRGRVTLAGDAAHPTTPTLGQGAGLAIEDAVVLAKELALISSPTDGAEVDIALRAYEGGRIPRTSAINRESWQISRSTMQDHPLWSRIGELYLQMTPARLWRARADRDAAYEA